MNNYYESQKMYYMQPRLPYEYQEIEYIESTGTQYIDTEIYGSSQLRVIIDSQITNVYSSCVFGARTSSSDTMFTYNISGGYFVSGFANELATTVLPQDANRHVVDKNKNKLYVDNVLKYTYSSAAFTTKLTMDIFAIASVSNDGHGYKPCSAKVYSCKIYDNDILIRDYVPCYQKENGKGGLYDLVNRKFYENKGTGEFIKGANSTKIIKFVKILGTTVLPYEYQEIEYIESTGTQYIDTEVIPTIDTQMEIEALTFSNCQFHIGSRVGAYTSAFVIWLYSGENKVQFSVGNYGSVMSNYSTNVTNKSLYSLNASTGQLKVNGNVASTADQVFSHSGYPIFICCTNSSGVAITGEQYKGRVYSCKIYNNDILIRDYVPCYRKSDGTAGLFDLVNRKFYENKGTGEFIKGSVVNNALNKFVKIISLYSLPIDYQEVEYIESTGTQYIDTNFYPTPKTKFCADLYFDYTNGKNPNANKAGIVGIAADFSMNFGAGAGQEQDIYIWLNSYNDDSSRVTVTTSLPKNTVVHFELDAANSTYIVGSKNGKVKTTKTTNSTRSAGLFGHISSTTNAPAPFNYFPMRAYTCKFYDNGKLVRNFIPCYRKSDKLAGLYDVIDKKFYSNSGTGEFNIGAEIINLPDQYQRVEYIESNEAYIDTEVLANENLSFETTAQFMSKGTASKSIYGGRVASNPTDGVQLHYIYSGSTMQFIYNDAFVEIAFDLNKNIYKVNKNKLYINGILSAEIPSASFSGPSIYLFATNTNGQTQFNTGTTLRMWYFKIWDGNTLVRDFVPCYRKSDGIIGLFDMVNKVFYTNTDTGEFIKGGDIK